MMMQKNHDRQVRHGGSIGLLDRYTNQKPNGQSLFLRFMSESTISIHGFSRTVADNLSENGMMLKPCEDSKQKSRAMVLGYNAMTHLTYRFSEP